MFFHYCIDKKHAVWDDDNYDSDYPIEGKHHPDWCKYCIHFGYIEDHYNACAKGSAYRIFNEGPRTVSFCGHCDDFKLATGNNKVPEDSRIKRLFLRFDNFIYKNRQKEK